MVQIKQRANVGVVIFSVVGRHLKLGSPVVFVLQVCHVVSASILLVKGLLQ